MPGSNSEIWRRFCDGSGSSIMVQYSLGPIITLDGRILQGNMWTGWIIAATHDLDVISEQQCSFPRPTIPTFTHLELFSHGLRNMNFSIFPGEHSHHIFTALNHSGQFWILE
jgi:hypothetical protein